MSARLRARSLPILLVVPVYGRTMTGGNHDDGIAARLDALRRRRCDVLTAHFPRGDAAVLLLVVLGDEPGLVLTRRASHLLTDPGHVAFPGGRVEVGESPTEAALRECEEEVGIPSTLITVHGHFDDCWNGAGFRIIPIVASAPGPIDLAPDADEIEDAAIVPLDHVRSRANHRVVVAQVDGFDFHDHVVAFVRGDDPWEIRGPSADLVRDLAEWLEGSDRRESGRRQRELDHFATNRWG